MAFAGIGGVLFQVAIGVGGYLLQSLLAPKPPDQVGPRLADVNVPAVSPGNPIIWHMGTMNLPTQLLWTSGLIETENREEVGGKGGPPKQTVITYSYSVSLAFGVCEGPIHRIRAIRANKKILWLNKEIEDQLPELFDEAYTLETSRLMSLGVDPDDAHVGGFIFAFNNYRIDEYVPATEAEARNYIMANPVEGAELDGNEVQALLDRMFSFFKEDFEYSRDFAKRYDDIRIYTGTEDQMPDPTIEEYEGVGNVPAHRGLCYVVLENLQLEDFGNTLPTFTAEVEKSDGTTYLIDVIENICLRAGMDPTEFSARCNMPTVPVHGFASLRNISARAALNELQKVYPFDGVESDFKVKFNWIEKRPCAVLDRNDFGAFDINDDRPSTLEVTRAHDFDFPRKITLTYQEPGRNYSINTVTAQRFLTESNLDEEITASLAIERNEAKKWIDKQFAHRFMPRRLYKTVLPPKYVIMEPSDVFLLADPVDPTFKRPYRVIECQIGANKLVNISFVDYFYSKNFIRNEEVVEVIDQVEPDTGALTRAFMFDTPLLTDAEDDNTGYYVALTGANKAWAGGFLIMDFASQGSTPAFGSNEETGQSGANWVTVAQNDLYMLNGYVLNKLGPANPTVRDWNNFLLVRFTDPIVELYSYDEPTLLENPYNMAFVGNELIQFAKATDLQGGVWKLEGLMRGLRGTDYWIPRHAKGDDFVKIRYGGVKRVRHDDNMLDVQSIFRAYEVNGNPEGVQAFAFTNTGNSKKPWAPALRAQSRLGNDWFIEWLPRARLNGELKSGYEVVIGQPYERYQIDVLDGGTVVRTVELQDLRDWTYTEAMQIEDFDGVQETLSLNVYQMGEMYNSSRRGYPLEVRV